MNKVVSFMSAAAFAVIAPLAASASVIDFEGFDNGDNVTSVTSTDGRVTATVRASARVPDASRASGFRFESSTARIFDSELDSTFDPDLEAPFMTGGLSLSPGNVLIIQEPGSGIPDDNATGGFIDFIFGSTVLFSGFTGLDEVNFRVTTGFGIPNQAEVELGQFRSPNDNGFGVFTLGTAVAVDSLRFRFQGASGAIDDLLVAPVPVPAALPLLLAGIGGLAVMKRRQKKASKA